MRSGTDDSDAIGDGAPKRIGSVSFGYYPYLTESDSARLSDGAEDAQGTQHQPAAAPVREQLPACTQQQPQGRRNT